MLWIIINDFILMIAKQLAVTINKNNTTAVSAASKPHSRLVKSKTFISKWMKVKLIELCNEMKQEINETQWILLWSWLKEIKI